MIVTSGVGLPGPSTCYLLIIVLPTCSHDNKHFAPTKYTHDRTWNKTNSAASRIHAVSHHPQSVHAPISRFIFTRGISRLMTARTKVLSQK